MSLRYGRTLPWHRELVVEEHRNIIESIRKGQPRDARRAMIKHINNVAGRVRLLESLTQGEKTVERQAGIKISSNPMAGQSFAVDSL